MLRFLLIALLLFLQFDVLSQSTKQQKKDMQVVNEYLYAAFNRDFDLQKNLMHEEIINHNSSMLEPSIHTREELINSWQSTLQSMDTAVYISKGTGIVNYIDGELKGEWVVSSGLVKSKFRESDEWVKFQMTGFYKVENGLIKEVRNFMNILDFYLQLGFTLEPPKK